jgi:hypothetical protein
MGVRSWRDVFSQEEMADAENTEMHNVIEDMDVSSMLDGYGWIDWDGESDPTDFDPELAFDPIARLFLEGLDEYCQRVDPDNHDLELSPYLENLIIPFDVIQDPKGFATRFTLVDPSTWENDYDEDEYEEDEDENNFDVVGDALDFLANHFFLKQGLEVSIDIQSIHPDLSDFGDEEKLALVRWNPDPRGKQSGRNRLENVGVAKLSKYMKLHGLTRVGTLVRLKWRGSEICPFCGTRGQIRVPFDLADAISRLNFNPTDRDALSVLSRLSPSERETMSSGIHDYCWPGGN